MQNRNNASRFTAVQRDIAQQLQKNDFTLIHVFDPERGSSFTYTVGLELRFEHPELIVLDLPPPQAAEFLNGLAAYVTEGRRFQAGACPRDIPADPTLCFHKVDRRHYPHYLNVCRWVYGGEHFRALQVTPADLSDPAYSDHLLLSA